MIIIHEKCVKSAFQFLIYEKKSVSSIKISVLNDCSLRNLGELPFDLKAGTCGTFNIKKKSRLLLCFSQGNIGSIDASQNPLPRDGEIQRCRMLTRKNTGLLSDIRLFNFDIEFEINVFQDSFYEHYLTTIANYKGKLLCVFSESTFCCQNLSY